MILITVATNWEAALLLENYQEKLSENSYRLGKCGILLVTGPGKKNVEKSLNRISRDISSIINIGVAGSLDKNIKLGEICRADKIYYRGKSAEFAVWPYNGFFQKLYPTELETRDFPILWNFGIRMKSKCLVDMEGAFFAEFSRSKSIPLAVIKIVSDYCSLTSMISTVIFHRSLIKQRLLRVFQGLGFNIQKN